MHPNDSRHLLPVNSMVFSRTTTDLASLQVHPHLSSANNNTNGYITARSAPALPHIPELSTYNITALPPPPPPAPPATSSPAKTQSEAATSPTRSAPQQPAWRMALSKFIKSFNAMRPRRGVKPSAENRPPLVIGHPTDFKHIETGGNEPLRTVQIANVPQRSN